VIVLLVLLWEKGKNCRGLRRTATTGKQMMRDCEVKGTVLYSTYVPAHPSTLVPWHQTNLKNATKDRTAICTSGTSQKTRHHTVKRHCERKANGSTHPSFPLSASHPALSAQHIKTMDKAEDSRNNTKYAMLLPGTRHSGKQRAG
jgi:hypothetical protein